MKAEISERDFYHMTLKSVRMHVEAYNDRMIEKQRFEIYLQWLNGMYTQLAVGSLFSKKTKYPKNPLEQTVDPEMTADELTEEEKDEYLRQFAKKIQAMGERFNEQKKKSEKPQP